MTDQTEFTELPELSFKAMLPFCGAALFWIGLGTFLCFKFSATSEEFRRAILWMFRLAFLSVLDLLAMAKVFYYVFELQRPEASQKRIFSAIRASYWGAIKIACIVLCGTILVKGSHLSMGIPPVGLVTGISTLVVVPLLGGLIWFFNQRPKEV